MAKYNNINADFFVDINGNILLRAKPLNSKQRKEIYIKYNGKCSICKNSVVLFSNNKPFFKRGEIDHIFPVSRGGQNNKENLRLVCLICNRVKSNG